MASRAWDLLKTLGKGYTVITGSFRPNGSSAIDNTLNTGMGYSVAWTSTGLFTITLDDSYVALVSANATFAMSAATDVKPQWGAIDVVTAKTLQLRSLAVAAVTDIASNAANRVHFCLVLRNSELGK